LTLGTGSTQRTFKWREIAGTSGNDAISLNLAGDGVTIQEYLNGTLQASFPAAGLGQIIVDGAAGNDVLIDSIPFAKRPSAGVFFRGGSGLDRVSLAGSSGDDLISADNLMLTLIFGGTVRTLEFADAEFMAIDGAAGSDMIALVTGLAMSGGAVTVTGGDGNDYLYGGNNSDVTGRIGFQMRCSSRPEFAMAA
jgi:Ca2+-binding RTX toxin-like protein